MIIYKYDGFVFNGNFYPFNVLYSVSEIKLKEEIGGKSKLFLYFEIQTNKEILTIQSQPIYDSSLYESYQERIKEGFVLTVKGVIMECEMYHDWFLNFEEVYSEFFKNYIKVKKGEFKDEE